MNEPVVTTFATAEPDTVPMNPPADAVTGEGDGQVDEEPARAGANQQGAEYDEQHDVGGAHVKRDPEDTVAAHEQRVDELLKPHGRPVEEAEKVIRIQRVENEESGDDHHCPPDGAAGRLQHQDDEYAADDDVGKLLLAISHVKRIDVVDGPDLDEQHERYEAKVD